ncbi:MAG: hypothetical protein Q6K80_06770 [Thermostichus sp. DG_1_6_bins_120]
MEANARAIAQLTQQNQQVLQTIAQTEEQIAGAEERIEAEVKRWDERFFSSAAIPLTLPAISLPSRQ